MRSTPEEPITERATNAARPIVSAAEIPPEEAEALLRRLAEGIVRRRLTAPALFALEMARPLNFLGSQLLIALDPFVGVLFRGDAYRKLALLLEEDRHLDHLLELIESGEAKHRRQQQTGRSRRRWWSWRRSKDA